jgi:hypothetical protein
MRKLIIAAVVVILLLFAADRLSKHFVQDRLAARIETQESVDGVAVDITGFPFLTQVLRNHFDEAHVSLPTLDTETKAGSLLVENLDVTLADIKTSHSYTRAVARSVTGSGSIPYSVFDQFAAIDVSYGGETADGSGYLDVTAPSLGGAGVRVQPDVADGLPDGVVIDHINATPDGLDVTLTGNDVQLTGRAEG